MSVAIRGVGSALKGAFWPIYAALAAFKLIINL